MLLKGFDRMLADGRTRRGYRRDVPAHPRSPVADPGSFSPTGADPGLAGRWRPVRDQINGISDRYDQPRVIVLKPAAANRPAGGVDRRLLAQADRAIGTLETSWPAGIEPGRR